MSSRNGGSVLCCIVGIAFYQNETADNVSDADEGAAVATFGEEPVGQAASASLLLDQASQRRGEQETAR
ncbi:hypothetical protein DES45_12410 [Microvirga subterranea]|uniref:Uncharacterized protein n=1 Tax=Microvirga subterranea TaxID=186651 RepID=A0A370H2G4_9HYPH|nr:hypothetical protein DES45_12410 [Microvirga subterranea]